MTSKNVNDRLNEHNKGLNQSTKHYIPLYLDSFITVKSSNKARELERYFKAGSGKAILKKRILSDEAIA